MSRYDAETNEQWTCSFGITALVFGCMAYPASFVPYLSVLALPLAGLSVIFAVFATIISMTRRWHGFGYILGAYIVGGIALFVGYSTGIMPLRNLIENTPPATTQPGIAPGQSITDWINDRATTSPAGD